MSSHPIHPPSVSHPMAALLTMYAEYWTHPKLVAFSTVWWSSMSRYHSQTMIFQWPMSFNSPGKNINDGWKWVFEICVLPPHVPGGIGSSSSSRSPRAFFGIQVIYMSSAECDHPIYCIAVHGSNPRWAYFALKVHGLHSDSILNSNLWCTFRLGTAADNLMLWPWHIERSKKKSSTLQHTSLLEDTWTHRYTTLYRTVRF